MRQQWSYAFLALTHRFGLSILLVRTQKKIQHHFDFVMPEVSNMITSSNGNTFRVTGHLCGEFTGPRWIPLTKASDAELWCFLDLRLNKRLSKQPWGWWFETLSRPLWRHRTGLSRKMPIRTRDILHSSPRGVRSCLNAETYFHTHGNLKIRHLSCWDYSGTNT